ncbi:P-loop containing nucleoside triphosphate hydrolase protein, partial [Ramaria rubella]
AHKVFSGQAASVKFLASAPTIASIPQYGGIPEISGRANTGKSSLINYITARKALAVTSSKPGRTQALNFFCVRRPKQTQYTTILVDAPGYGSRGRPEWGELFEHYVRNREELRRVFILINAEHGVTADDRLMLQFLERESETRPFSVQAVLTKTDKVPLPMVAQVVHAHQQTISEVSPTCLPAIQTAVGKRRFGDMDLRRSILQACGWS